MKALSDIRDSYIEDGLGYDQAQARTAQDVFGIYTCSASRESGKRNSTASLTRLR